MGKSAYFFSKLMKLTQEAPKKRRYHRSRAMKKILTSDPKKLLHLYRSIKEEDAALILLRITNFIEEQTGAEKAFLLLVSDEQDELTCRVVGNTILAEELKFPLNQNSFSIALTTKRTLSLEDIKKEHLDILCHHSHCQIWSLYCVPIFNPRNLDKVIMLACVVNKPNFTPEDEEVIEECCNYTVPLLMITLTYEEEKRLRTQCQSLLTVAKNLFTHLDDVTLLLKEIMSEARNLTKAERCSLFLLEKEENELVAKVFDGNTSDNKIEILEEVRIPATQGIAGHVATTGKPLNIHDAYSHPLFYRKMDETTGFKTRSILCFPIKDAHGVIGVAELCNKINGRYFSSFDEEIAKAFSIYCGISIMHSLMWERVRDAQHRSRLSNELMMYHMQVSNEDSTTLAKQKIPEIKHFDVNFASFTYTPRCLSEADTPLATLAMFEDLGLTSTFRISIPTLSKFVLMVKRGYRDPPYHNWIHAFSVGHFCFLLLKNLNIMGNELSKLECLALFVACLCHDLDHRGTTNSFQVTSQSILAALYSSEGSVMERHHFAQALGILNTEECNIFENLKQEEYTKCLDCLRDVILATDLAHHLRISSQIQQMANDGYDSKNASHHQLLLYLFVSSCDLSDQTKEWRVSKKIAELVYSEFFSQGDLEKAMGVNPSEMMDREKACIPELQINFLQNIVKPLFGLLTQLFPKASATTLAVENNLLYWSKMRDVYLRRRQNNSTSSSLDIFEDDALEEEVFNEMKNIETSSKQNPNSENVNLPN